MILLKTSIFSKQTNKDHEATGGGFRMLKGIIIPLVTRELEESSESTAW